MPNMNFGENFDLSNNSFKRKFRWLLEIPDVCGDRINTLPPSKSARPSISFKEIEVQHLSETIYFPGKPDWKPLNLTVYDVKTSSGNHPIIDWIAKLYEVNEGSATYKKSCDGFKVNSARLSMFDGCGNTCETWIFESAWVQSADFGELEMSSSDITYCDLTLRYDRAYWIQS
jgi:hypothetical protein